MKSDYEPLLSEPALFTTNAEEELEAAREQRRPASSASHLLRVTLIVSLIANIILATRISSHVKCPPADPVYQLYSPALGAIKYEQRVFDRLGHRSKYHGPPTNETDKNWDDLYEIGLSRITKAEADLLPNRTEGIPGDEDHYIITLDVFHQLHCLNGIRKALWPEVYDAKEQEYPLIHPNPPDFDHTDHCINTIRESLMCHGDVSVNVWQWNEEDNWSMPHFDNVHTCRNHDSLLEWAKEHRLAGHFDKNIRVVHAT